MAAIRFVISFFLRILLVVRIDGFEGEFTDNSPRGIRRLSKDRRDSLARDQFSLSEVLVGVGLGRDLSWSRKEWSRIVSKTVLFEILNSEDIWRIEWPKDLAPIILPLVLGDNSFLEVLGTRGGILVGG